MNDTEQQLLDNVLDSFDRLSDRQSQIIDIWALLHATAEALRNTPHHKELEGVLPALRQIMRSGATADDQRNQALSVTEVLRHYLADVLPLDGEIPGKP